MTFRTLKLKTVWVAVSWVGRGDGWLAGGMAEAPVAAGAGPRPGQVAGEGAAWGRVGCRIDWMGGS